jgi:hypothetical protein
VSNKPRLSSWTLTQEEDCCGRINESFQELTIEIADGGGGAYGVLTTTRWAVEPDDLRKLADAIEKVVADEDKATEEADKKAQA